jgi:hypothetical protein
LSDRRQNKGLSYAVESLQLRKDSTPESQNCE